MKNTLSLIFLIIVMGSSVQAEPTPPVAMQLPPIESITVNGLIAGKAVVTIGGRRHIMRIGQKVANVQLVEADQYSAVLRIGDKSQRFYLQEARLEDYSDDFITKSVAVTEEQADILASNQLVRAKSHIIKVELLERLDDRARFRIEYFYNASHGARALLRAATYSGGRNTGYSSYTHTQLEPGRNLADIIVMMNDKAPETYASDAIKFEISGEKAKGGELKVLSKYTPFEKVWQRQAQQPEIQLGNAVWKTGSQ